MQSTLKKRFMAFSMVVMMVVSLFWGTAPTQQVSAATSNTSALYYNTGHRDTVATALSDAARAYYKDFAYDYSKIADGSVVVDDKLLSTALANYMQSTLENQVTYSSLPTYWNYSDAEDGKAGVTFFYTDNNSTSTGDLNREHVWPKSAGSFYELFAGADLHHLRPAHATVNSARNNYEMGEIDETSGATAVTYSGKTAGYLKGNQFEPLENVKGDVARIFLYVYLCWNQPNLCWNVPSVNLPAFDRDDSKNDGTKRIESLETLLQWCYDDPVDTWEMGRNDICEIVQGNRNVFIDYPEYAWLIFGLEVPEGIASPSSGNDKHGVYNPGDLSYITPDVAKVEIDEEQAISLAEANKAAVGAIVTVVGQVTGTFGLNDSMTSAIIADENGDTLQLYFNNSPFKYEVGDVIAVNGSISEYHGVKQINTGFASKLLTKAADATPVATPVEVTVAELVADADAYLNKNVIVKNVVLGKPDSGNNTTEISQTIDGVTSTMNLYYPASYPGGVAMTDTVNITAIASKRDAEAQLRVGKSADYVLVSKGEGYHADLTTEAGILDAVFILGKGENLGQAVTLTGEITGIQTAYSSEHNNVSVNIKVADKTILCYRLAGGSELQAGDTIKVTGDITNYNGTVEFVMGSTYVKVGGTTPTVVPTTVPTIAPTGTVIDLTTEEGILKAAFALEKGASLGQKVSLTGEITSIKTDYDPNYNNITVNMKVADKTVQAFRLAGGSELLVGDRITVTGDITNYNGTIEFVADSTYVKASVITPTVVPTTVPTIVPTQIPVEGDVFKKINSVDELEVGTKYIIYGVNETNNNEQTAYAMGNALSSNRIKGVSVSVENDTIVNKDASLVWTIDMDAEGNYTLFNDVKGQYLTLKNNSTKPFEFEAAPSSAYTVSAEDGNFNFRGTAVARNISIYTTDFRAYIDGGKEIQKLNLYKLYVPEYAFQKIDSVSALEDGNYIIYGVNGDFNGALNNVVSKNLAGVSAVEFTEEGYIAKDADPSIVWEIKKNDDGRYTIYNTAAAKYLCVVEDENKGLGLNDTATSTYAVKFMDDATVRFESENNGRGICIYQSDFRAYKETIFDQFNYQNFLYKLSEVEPQVGPTPIVTPEPTPIVTPDPTPIVTPDPTPIVTPEPTEIPSIEGNYKLINTAEELGEGGYVVFYGISSQGGSAYAMGNKLSSSRPLGVAVEVNDGVIASPDASIVWIVEKDGDGNYTLRNAASGKYLNLSKDSTSPFALADTAVAYRLLDAADGNFQFQSTVNTRILSIYTKDFRAYNSGAKEMGVLNLYKQACNHVYESVTVDATCTENGVITYTCGKCGDVYTEEIPATGHSYEDTVIEPTCTEQGYTMHTCTKCNDSYVDSYVDALGHNYEITDSLAATDFEAGYIEYTCSRCNDSYKEIIYKAITSKVNSDWGTGFNAEITVTNKSNEVIDDWTITFSVEGKLESVWNAQVVSEETVDEITTYVLKNLDWNKTIQPGASVTVGFVGSGNASTIGEIVAKQAEKAIEKAEGAIRFRTTSEWDGGFVGELIITNNSAEEIRNWSIEGDFGCVITSLWNGKIVSTENSYYVICNEDYNAIIVPGASVVVGFTADGSASGLVDAIGVSFAK